jgi:hypothetical protein
LGILDFYSIIPILPAAYKPNGLTILTYSNPLIQTLISCPNKSLLLSVHDHEQTLQHPAFPARPLLL